MDAKTALSFLQKALPWIGAAATGNVPALVALGADAVSSAMGKPIDATPDAIAQCVAGATPAELTKLRQADEELKLKAQALGFEHAEDMRKLDIEEATLDVSDTKDARTNFSKDRGVFIIGIIVLIVHALMVAAVLFGCYALITGKLSLGDAGIVATIFTLIGMIIRDIDGRAAQVISYFFGSSHSSSQKNDIMAATMQDLTAKAATPPAPGK